MLDFNLEELIVILVRIIGSFPVIFFPFIGSLFAIIVDLSDLFLINYIDLGGVQNYQNLDKFLDLFYMFAFFFVSLKWNRTEKIISIILFSYRIIGVVLFLLFDLRIILLIFPNIFEFWFVGISAYKFYSKSKISNLILFRILFISTILKILHEIFIHKIKTLDNYSVDEFINLFI